VSYISDTYEERYAPVINKASRNEGVLEMEADLHVFLTSSMVNFTPQQLYPGTKLGMLSGPQTGLKTVFK
jgi:hypothetical protein